jgi:hypothetical protein
LTGEAKHHIKLPVLARFLLGAAGLVWVVFLRVGKPGVMGWLDSLPPACPLKIWFGIKCAFCGMTHAMVHLLYFDFGEAIRSNLLALPLFFTSIVVLLFLATRSWHQAGSGTHLLAKEKGKGGMWTALGILAAYAVIRNFIPI